MQDKRLSGGDHYGRWKGRLDAEVYDLLLTRGAGRGGMTKAQISKLVGRNPRTVKKCITRLQQVGKVLAHEGGYRIREANGDMMFPWPRIRRVSVMWEGKVLNVPLPYKDRDLWTKLYEEDLIHTRGSRAKSFNKISRNTDLPDRLKLTYYTTEISILPMGKGMQTLLRGRTK